MTTVATRRPAQLRTAVTPRLRIRPRTRKAILVAHVIASVALLGQVWVNAVLALTAMRTADRTAARVAYEFMQLFVHTSAIPLSVLALGSGILVSLGTKWGVFRYYWVVAKLGLLIATVVTGIVIQQPLIEELLATAEQAVRPAATPWQHLAAIGFQVLLLTTATVLSVYKPGGRIRG